MIIDASKEVVMLKDISIDVKGVTLLSEEEYNRFRRRITLMDSWWWLRSPGSTQYYVAAVNSDGSLYLNNVFNSSGCVRPALICESDLTGVYKIVLLGMRWTVLDDSLILCDECIGKTAFRSNRTAPDANVYEASDVKKYLENWANEKGLL